MAGPRKSPASRPPTPPAPPGRPPSAVVSALGWLAGALALGALAFACRGAPLGTPVADDYDYLYALRFEHPLDPWGPMGSAWYWRPLSRQLYFLLFAPWMQESPWRIALLHGALLLALFVCIYRTARRWVAPATAAAIATFPVVAVPARALLGWPTGAQPLLGMLFAALAAHEAAARRTGTALLALLAALLSHGQAVLAVPALPLAAGLAAKDRCVALRSGLGAAAVLGAYLAAAAVARQHGAGLPPRAPWGEAAGALGPLLARATRVQLGLEELGPTARGAIVALEAALALLTAFAFARPAARARLRAHAPLATYGAFTFAVGVALLAFAPSLFTPRHTCIPSLGLAVAVGLVAGAASEALAVAWTAVRILALVLSPPAPAALAVDLPGGLAPMSFQEIVRLQRTAGAAHLALLAAYPRLPRGATVRYWSLPHSSEIAFAGERAVCVWYGDSTLSWTFWDRGRTPPEAAPPPTLAFNLEGMAPAVVMRPEAVRRYEEAMADLARDRLPEADAAFARAVALQSPPVRNFAVEIVRLRARIALELDALARADSLNELDRAWSGSGASYHELRAVLLWRRGEREAAAADARACLALMPQNAIARAIVDSVDSGVGGPAGAPMATRVEPAPETSKPR